MGIQANDIQLNNAGSSKARALRFVDELGDPLLIEDDPDLDTIKIITVPTSGGGGGASRNYFPSGW